MPKTSLRALYSNQIPPGAADVVHYLLEVPPEVTEPITIEVTAALPQVRHGVHAVRGGRPGLGQRPSDPRARDGSRHLPGRGRSGGRERLGRDPVVATLERLRHRTPAQARPGGAPPGRAGLPGGRGPGRARRPPEPGPRLPARGTRHGGRARRPAPGEGLRPAGDGVVRPVVHGPGQQAERELRRGHRQLPSDRRRGLRAGSGAGLRLLQGLPAARRAGEHAVRAREAGARRAAPGAARGAPA